MALLIAGVSTVVPSPVAPKERTFKMPPPARPVELFSDARLWDRTGAAPNDAPANPAPAIFRKSLRPALSVMHYSFLFTYSRYGHGDGTCLRTIQSLAN